MTKRFGSALTGILLSMALVLGCGGSALAKPTDNDIVGGATAAQRGLSGSNLPSITAKSAYVIDSDGNVYLERNADQQRQIASITKVMTCIVAIENADLNSRISVSENAANIGESTAQLAKGDTLTLKDALKGLMIPSGNDAATAIAENVGSQMLASASSSGQQTLDSDGRFIDPRSSDAGYRFFVSKMNEKAKELGMDNTVFTNPHGLDIKQFTGEKLHSSARDVSKMSVYGMQNETFREICSLSKANIVVNRNDKPIKIKLEGTDTLLDTYDGACGIKTGHTQNAGGCFTGAVNRDGKYLYAVVLGASSNEQKLKDAETIYDWVYGNIKDVPLVNSSVNSADDGSGSPVVAEVPHTDWLDKTMKATIADTGQTVKANAIFGNVTQNIVPGDVAGDVKKGDAVGSLELRQGDKVLATADLVACEDCGAPGPLDNIWIALSRFFGKLGGSPEHADVVIHNKMEPILSKV